MTLTLGVILILSGALVGFLAGLLGIGGGLILTPIFTFLLPFAGIETKVAVHMAIATSLATIMFTSLSSMRAHHKRGAVLWPLVLSVTPGILIGSMTGAKISSMLSTFWISMVVVTFVLISAIKMLKNAKPSPSRELPGLIGQIMAGLVIGVLSALVGGGGAFISVPLMVYCNVKMQNAVGTSAALGFPIAVAGTVGYVLTGLNVAGLPSWPISAGFVHLPALFCCVVASVIFAPIGAKVAHSIDTKPLKKLFACNLFIIASLMFYKAISSL